MKSSNNSKVFIVEDDPIYIRLVKYVFELDPDNEIFLFTSGEECLANLHLNPSIVSLDYTLPDINGEEVLEQIKAQNPNIEVIILSGQNDISIAVKLLGAGAHDYIEKTEETKERLLYSLQRLKNNINLRKEVNVLKKELEYKNSLDKAMIGKSKPMLRVYELMNKAIKTNISISITGETGSGKEVVAKNIHKNSNQNKGAFIAINVSAIPKDLLESELFGHEKGAFTGADQKKIGLFELADKGTLFLDEIVEMDIHLQTKLLRAIQEREIMRVGGTAPIKFDARIIVATHKNISNEVEKGNFREDLYYRLLGLPIEIPPLRKRGNDIILLAIHFLIDFCISNNIQKKSISKAAKTKLLSYYYPGNVRELKAVIELACVMSENDMILPEDITFNSPRKNSAFLIEEMPLKEYTRKIIFHFLEKYNNDVLLVAQKLDIGKSTIYRLLKEEAVNQ